MRGRSSRPRRRWPTTRDPPPSPRSSAARDRAWTATQNDLKAIKSINLSQATINDLDPCVFPLFTGMKDLFLGPGDLDNLTPLATLTQLITLRASINKVSDVSPLAKMTQMDRLAARG